MGRKERLKKLKNNGITVQWCWYCEREFHDEKTLSDHQQVRHFGCTHCSKNFRTVSGLVEHANNVHKITIKELSNCKPGRSRTKVQCFGMAGIPPEDLRIWKESKKEAMLESIGVGAAEAGINTGGARARARGAAMMMGPGSMAMPGAGGLPFPMFNGGMGMPMGMPMMNGGMMPQQQMGMGGMGGMMMGGNGMGMNRMGGCMNHMAHFQAPMPFSAAATPNGGAGAAPMQKRTPAPGGSMGGVAGVAGVGGVSTTPSSTVPTPPTTATGTVRNRFGPPEPTPGATMVTDAAASTDLMSLVPSPGSRGPYSTSVVVPESGKTELRLFNSQNNSTLAMARAACPLYAGKRGSRAIPHVNAPNHA